jgi:hypothetical protein
MLSETNPSALEWGDGKGGEDPSLKFIQDALKQVSELQALETSSMPEGGLNANTASSASSAETLRTEDTVGIISKFAQKHADVAFLRRLLDNSDALELFAQELEGFVREIQESTLVVTPPENMPTMDKLLSMLKDVPDKAWDTMTMDEIVGSSDFSFDPSAEDWAGRTMKQLFEEVDAVDDGRQPANGTSSEEVKALDSSGAAAAAVQNDDAQGQRADAWDVPANDLEMDADARFVEIFVSKYTQRFGQDVDDVAESLSEFMRSELYTEMLKDVSKPRQGGGGTNRATGGTVVESSTVEGKSKNSGSDIEPGNLQGGTEKTEVLSGLEDSNGAAAEPDQGEGQSEEDEGEEGNFVVLDAEQLGLKALREGENIMIDKDMWAMMLKDPGETCFLPMLCCVCLRVLFGFVT